MNVLNSNCGLQKNFSQNNANYILYFAVIVFFIFAFSPNKAISQVYQTVQDGNWQSQNTWLNGNKPNVNQAIGNNKQIYIYHNVSIQGKDLEIDGNSNTLVEVNGGSLGGNGNGIKSLIIKNGKFKAVNAEVEFKALENYDQLELESTCFTIYNGNYKFDGGNG